jgi:hypothetical protein
LALLEALVARFLAVRLLAIEVVSHAPVQLPELANV